MFNLKNLFHACLLLTVFSPFLIAQEPPAIALSGSPTSKSNQENFVSLDGGFSIALPQSISGFRGIPTNENVKSGSFFNWESPKGVFTASYIEYISTPNDSKGLLELVSNNLIQQYLNKGAELLKKEEFSFDGNPGIEVRMHLKVGATAIARYYLVKDRLYVITSGWADKENGTTQLKVLDSFKLINGNDIIAKKLEAATPKELPQSTVTKRITNDAQDERLKGNVKTLIEEEEDLTGTWSVRGIKKSSETYFNEEGNKIKKVSYDYKGNPSTIVVYGYINGARVSNENNIDYEYNPPPMGIPAGASNNNKIRKPVDNRYSNKYEYKYDTDNKIKELLNYRNTGELDTRTTYIYNGNKITETIYDSQGKVSWKTTETYDDKGNLIEAVYDNTSSKRPDSKYTYTYDSFDEKGNWTKRIITGKEAQFDGSFKEQHYVEYRTLSYYP